MNSPLFYFVRHGETEWNVERRLQGRLDIPLNDVGRRQSARCASTLCRLLAGHNKAPADFAFISSPLSRARETMEILRGGLGLPRQGYAVEPRLAELSFGRWEGLTYAELRALDDVSLKVRNRDKWHFAAPGGESYAELLSRLREWHDAVDGDIIVAAHGGVARALAVLFGARTQKDALDGNVDQGVVYEFGPGVMSRYE